VAVGTAGGGKNETLVRERVRGMQVKSGVEAGMLAANHNETFVREAD
jgi:hypothetical protein